MTTNLTTTQWLADHLEAPDIAIVDASWFMPDSPRDPEQEYLEAHIPGAIRFDIDTFCDPSSDLPHMLPSPVGFSSAMRKVGIGDGQRIVVYDSVGLGAAPRVWWMFRVMGVEDVSVLDGGLPKWTAENRPLETGPVRRPECHFTARLDHGAVSDIADVRRVIDNGTAQVLDARSKARFDGTTPEPRAGLRSGHMPGSLNLPFEALISDGRLKTPEDLRDAFAASGIDLNQPIVTTCGSGVTACTLALALAEIGHRKVSVYDGSWTEWAGLEDTPIETG